MQGLFAIIEFENEESVLKVLSHGEDLLLRGRRLVVRRRRTKQMAAAAGTDAANDNSDNVEQSAADLHSQLLSKLTTCNSVCTSLLCLRYVFKHSITPIFGIICRQNIAYMSVGCTSIF